MGWRGRGPAVCARVQRRSWRCAPPAPSEGPVRGVRRCSPRASWVGEASSLARAGSAGARMETAPPPAAWRCSATKRRRRPRAWRRQRANSSCPGARCAWRPMRAGGGVWCGRPRVASGPLGSRGCLPASTVSTGRASRRQSRPPPRAACRARQRGLRAPAARGAGGRRSRPSSRIRRRRRWRRRRARTPTAHRAPHAGRPPPAPARLESPSASAAAAWTRGARCAGRVPPAAPAAARARRERASLAACAV